MLGSESMMSQSNAPTNLIGTYISTFKYMIVTDYIIRVLCKLLTANSWLVIGVTNLTD